MTLPIPLPPTPPPAELAAAVAAVTRAPERPELWDEAERLAADIQRPEEVALAYGDAIHAEIPKDLALELLRARGPLPRGVVRGRGGRHRRADAGHRHRSGRRLGVPAADDAAHRRPALGGAARALRPGDRGRQGSGEARRAVRRGRADGEGSRRPRRPRHRVPGGALAALAGRRPDHALARAPARARGPLPRARRPLAVAPRGPGARPRRRRAGRRSPRASSTSSRARARRSTRRSSC